MTDRQEIISLLERGAGAAVVSQLIGCSESGFGRKISSIPEFDEAHERGKKRIVRMRVEEGMLPKDIAAETGRSVRSIAKVLWDAGWAAGPELKRLEPRDEITVNPKVLWDGEPERTPMNQALRMKWSAA